MCPPSFLPTFPPPTVPRCTGRCALRTHPSPPPAHPHHLLPHREVDSVALHAKLVTKADMFRRNEPMCALMPAVWPAPPPLCEGVCICCSGLRPQALGPPLFRSASDHTPPRSSEERCLISDWGVPPHLCFLGLAVPRFLSISVPPPTHPTPKLKNAKEKPTKNLLVTQIRRDAMDGTVHCHTILKLFFIWAGTFIVQYNPYV
eukprot:GGOE01048140.1.p1 GENE.GGOE01048140.1~~GGOE01048140.1.p1  ORF type:complete len:203 (+),score=1.87 GGOE01048140.1:508-1116(+)